MRILKDVIVSLDIYYGVHVALMYSHDSENIIICDIYNCLRCSIVDNLYLLSDVLYEYLI